MIFTLNEALHLPSCLEHLTWCDDVIVIDSFSSDNTETIAKNWGAGFFQNEFSGFGTQRNWAFSNVPIKHPWVLVLDADERVPQDLAKEILSITVATDHYAAYRLRRRFHMWGRWLKRSSLYPNWVVRLVQPSRVRYVNRGHAETQEIDGEIGILRNDLIDENLKGVDEWFERQARYAGKEADYELRHSVPLKEAFARLFSLDPLTRRSGLKVLAWRLPFRSSFYFLYAYFLRGGFLDGRDGYQLCRMKSIYQGMIASKKYSRKKALKP